uniref:Pyruvate carboxylase n=1 Tax=Macrostomum lignano TaxID=282301 RepID=A0A1I8IMS1_9PLAT
MASGTLPPARKFEKVLVANRGEIAMRIYRALSEMEIKSVGVYSEADTMHMHRTMADESYLIGKGLQPVQAYLSISHIIQVAKETKADAVHPGYGFLSESAEFAQACHAAGIAFIGPRPETVRLLGDKVLAREAAVSAGVPVVPGSPGAIADAAAAEEFCRVHGLPVILKAAAGGGGRGMRVVRRLEDVAEAFERASSEATAAFGNGSMFVERFVVSARHIEVQILADKAGSVIHLFERDCSVQRRHQKVLELAPAHKLRQEAREAILSDAVKLAKSVGYENAGTVEFLFEESTGRHYFMEVNPRVQVEHTVTEEITGVDIVRTQIRIAEGHSLSSLGLNQSEIAASGCAMQCRVTTEDPERDFQPDSGRLEYFRPGLGPGIRLDSASAFAGAIISPYYDSLLCKVVAHTGNFAESTAKMRRALREFRVIGVSTNIAFLLNLLSCEEFCTVAVDTGFLDRNPQLMRQRPSRGRVQKLLRFIVAVPPDGWRKILKQKGPEAFAKAILDHPGVLLTDTTMRDAHQSLLATRVRTYDLVKIAPFAARRLSGLLSMECWGGATFDVSLRFLHECPWQRLRQLRDLVPNIPFQMLLRGANAVGYTNYADNVVYRFCEEAVKTGMDIFRIFDCLNYVPNMLVGMDAVRKAGGVVEAAICYTGDLLTSKKYTLEYYLDTAEQLGRRAHPGHQGHGRPVETRVSQAAGHRFEAEIPRPPAAHSHSRHGRSRGGHPARLLRVRRRHSRRFRRRDERHHSATVHGAVVGCVGRSPGVQPADVADYNAYWEMTRRLYVNFECTNTMRSGNADVYDNEIPGGQYTNLHFQSISLGLADQFALVKKKFAEANQLLGDLIKVTPSSKVVGDLAQFMVQNKLSSTVCIGQPHGGFPAELAAAVLHGRKPKYTSRPGAEIPPFDFEKLRRELEKKFGQGSISDCDLMSAALYPKVFDEFAEFRRQFGDVSKLSTRSFFQGPKIAEELELYLDKGITVYVKSLAITEPDKIGQRRCFFEVNGQLRVLHTRDREASKDLVFRRKAQPKENLGEVGAPMPGEILSVRVTPGQVVAKGQPLLALSAMKMELTVASPLAGKVHSVWVNAGDKVEGNDLLVTLEAEKSE